MESQVLKALQTEFNATKPVVELSYVNVLAKFGEVSGTMNTFDKAVHFYFFDSYATKFADDIQKALVRIMDCNEELLLTSAINKLALKLPKPNLELFGFTSDYHLELAKLTIAGIIWHVLMDTKQIQFKRETKKVDGKWSTLTKLSLGGDETKDIMKGLHFKPGQAYQKKCEGFTLKSEHKKRLKRLASIPFKLSDIATPELIMKGYQLKDDWDKRTDKNGRRLPEHHLTKVERYEGYRDAIMGLQGKRFYLELKYSGSGRMFYKYQLEGMRPQGKLWETLIVDSDKAYEITQEQQTALVHHIYCGLNGVRVTPAEALEKWDESLLQKAAATDPMTALNDEEFGEMLLLRKAAIALGYARAGVPTHYMFGWDFTTSGLIVAGNSFRSPEMMKGGNVHTGTTVFDAHTNFNDLLDLGLPRKEAKKIHQPLLHGGTWKGLLDIVHNVTKDDSLDMKELKARLYRVYGSCVDNIVDIADWGTEVVCSDQSTVSWTLPDGFRATHKSYFQSVHNKITVVSCDDTHKSGKTSHTVIKDMPYSTDNAGKALTLKSVDEGGNTIPAPLKIRGLYANITHSLDAYVLRHVADKIMSDGKPIMLKHDDFMVHPSAYNTVLETAQLAFGKLYRTNYYQVAMDDIARNSVQTGCIAPTLLMGDAANVVDQSTTFLMP